MKNTTIYELVREVPEHAKKQITAGRLKGFTDINPMWRIKTLTEQFGVAGFGWYYKTIEKWTEQAKNGETLCFVTIQLFIKIGEDWSAPIEGTGGSKISVAEKNGIYNDDEGFKKATTDALGIACKNLGIGADVWWYSDRTKYTQQAGEAAKRISPEQFKILENEMKICGVNVEQVIATCGVRKLEEIASIDFEKVMKKLQITKEMRAKQ